MSKLVEIKEHLAGILLDLDQVPSLPQGMSYPELKMQLMVNYVANLAYYLTLRIEGHSVAEHPVFKHLAFLRTFMERLVPLDASLKYQIDKLLLFQETNSEDEQEGPNLAAFVPNALKAIPVAQVTKGEMSGSFEIDPAMIAAQIMKVQRPREEEVRSTKKAKIIVEEEMGSSDEEINSSDEEIESSSD